MPRKTSAPSPAPAAPAKKTSPAPDTGRVDAATLDALMRADHGDP
ncbi:MAG: 1,4-alpha-glucan branching protein GlgB, partial [Pseudomonadota bacterium]